MDQSRSRFCRLALPAFGLTAALAAAALGTQPAQSAEPAAYRLLTSDLMTAVIQPRHVKLWLAGKAGNWDYVAYEAQNLSGAFGRLAEAVPLYQGHSTPEMLTAFAQPQLAAVEAAAKAKDARAFASAYESLTLGCNQCHQASNHPVVVIQTPTSSAFPDQAFAPASH